MLPNGGVWIGIAGTLVLWVMSGILAISMALMLAAASLSAHRPVRILARTIVNVTRGIPTSVFVLAAGIGTMHLVTVSDLPVVFPGTTSSFQHLAWAITFALALGSAGHMAEVFRSARSALGRARLEQAAVLGLSRLRHAALIARECAAIAMAPLGARLVHHLHNTAFAALFPVAELFGAIEEQATATFQVLQFATLGCVIYAVLTGLTWTIVRWLEMVFGPTTRRAALRGPA